MIEILGDRQAVFSREMTKTYEEFLRGPLSRLRAELSARPAIKGEITLLVSGDIVEKPFCFEDILPRVEKALRNGKTSVSALARELSAACGVSKNLLYEKILEVKSTMENPSDDKKGE
jgi:16S rRNA (cytidine1402-2'-O)-methyltransferase